MGAGAVRSGGRVYLRVRYNPGMVITAGMKTVSAASAGMQSYLVGEKSLTRFYLIPIDKTCQVSQT